MLTPAVMALKDEGAYRVLAAAQALEKQGKRVVHLEIGQPAFATPQYVLQATKDALDGGFTTYVNPSGTLELKQAIAQHVSKTRGVNFTSDNVVVGPGAKPGLFFATQAILNPGDEVLMPDPGFPAYQNLAMLFNCTAVRYDALAPNLGATLKGLLTSKTKAIILNSPSNPTGRVLSVADLAGIATALSAFPKCWVISDEIYCHLVFDEDNKSDVMPITPSIASIPEILPRCIIVDGFSKMFSMTGFRLGFVVCPKELAERLHLLMTHAVGCTASFTQRAGTIALSREAEAREAVSGMVKEYQNRRDYVVKRLNEMPGINCPAPKGAFYAFADVSGVGVSSRELSTRCLNDGLVAILPGGDFGPNGENFIRISFVGAIDVLKEGMDRMSAVVNAIVEEKEKKKSSSPTKRVKGE